MGARVSGIQKDLMVKQRQDSEIRINGFIIASIFADFATQISLYSFSSIIKKLT